MESVRVFDFLGSCFILLLKSIFLTNIYIYLQVMENATFVRLDHTPSKVSFNVIIYASLLVLPIAYISFDWHKACICVGLLCQNDMVSYECCLNFVEGLPDIGFWVITSRNCFVLRIRNVYRFPYSIRFQALVSFD